ncbi:hypothetical protein BO71DRAFT_469040 [Aspergillus ellipticus CBS 707.79]|uniref:Uncharacterized protein n=1 Tax=Aspergillus ellipticus CBS 707.79 TaxID=1448320 RepID=A0A319CSQ0_9EURO|nr:hypothetical protein BO71DRAFT_469040 [Aspergillus ellipticus CBS 707.79]
MFLPVLLFLPQPRSSRLPHSSLRRRLPTRIAEHRQDPRGCPPQEPSRFTFVGDGHPAGARSHAMRVHWTERHRARRDRRQQQQSARRALPLLAPRKARETFRPGSPGSARAAAGRGQTMPSAPPGWTPSTGPLSLDALRFKADAVQILRQWLQDPAKSLGNDAFAAVVRLMTFEGLVDVRPVVVRIHERPVRNLRAPPPHSILGSSIDVQKMRCLWLISFIQDMRTLLGRSSRLYQDGLRVFPALHAAGLLIRTHGEVEGHRDTTRDVRSDSDRLPGLLAISILVQASLSRADVGQGDELIRLDRALATSRSTWEGSIQRLFSCLQDHFEECHPHGALRMDYVLQTADVVSHLSLEAHRGIEKCLLNMLCRTRDGALPFYVDDGGTPDSLLSTVHGY